MNCNPETLLTHLASNPKKNNGVVSPPVYHASTIIFDNYAAFRKSWEGTYAGITYGRHGSQSHKELENTLCALEGYDKCLLTNSGVSAITVTLLALLNKGDHILVADSVYSPTRSFCNSELKRFGVETTYYNPLVGGGIASQIQKNTKVIFVESPGSLTFEIQDIPAIVRAAHKAGAVVVMDNTWATPLYFKASKYGVDVSIHSATKYISGHSDLLMGVINCGKKLYPQIKRTYKSLGICVAPDEVYLAQRGLRTLAVRLDYQQKAAINLAKWLEKQPQVAAVIHPALKTHPQHKIWQRDFAGASGLFAFTLKNNLDTKAQSKFLDKMELFKLGYSWGGFESLIVPFELSKIRSHKNWQHKGSAYRISVGLENIDDLIADLENALKRI